MAAMDFFCSADDRHRVILLVDLLERAGQRVTLRCEPVADPTRPCMVACTRRALREPWILDLFHHTAPSLVVVRLDEAPLPGPCARIIDMQAWPARSADRQVGALVQWLQHGGGPPAGGGGARGGAGKPGNRGSAAGTRGTRVRAVQRPRNVLGGLGVLVLLVVGGVLLYLAVPERRANSTDRAGGVSRIEPEQQDGGGPAAAAPPAGPGASITVSAVPASAGVASDSAAPLDMAAPVPADSPPAPLAVPPSRDHLDALAHLCRARTPEAARAWAGALNWKQRRRLPHEPCVHRLVQQAGYESLAEVLGRR